MSVPLPADQQPPNPTRNCPDSRSRTLPSVGPQLTPNPSPSA
uniref:Uncharacterized protein n=1 Tax=Romanomermis culicivorax TaxID=13658 RepID=A0A915I9J2_ROMCU